MKRLFRMQGRVPAVAKVTLLVVLIAGFWSLGAWTLGRMTGGGSFFTADGVRVTHGFELYCQQELPATIGPNNLEVNWNGNHFHLETLTSSACHLETDPTPPKAPISTYLGCGTGSYNGQPNYYACWTFVDAGEPGTNDTAWFALYTPLPYTLVFQAGPSKLTFGNQQAHYVTGGKLPTP
jgi:hypothetical protein